MSAEIELVPITREVLTAAREGPATLEQRFQVRIGAAAHVLGDVLALTERMLTQSPRPPEFGAFLAVDRATRDVVGTCAFKDPPSESGEVEIAYFTFPPFEGKGFATQMAEALVLKCVESGRIRKVVAHTLAVENASTRVLRKIGMTFVGERMDPEDGRVWRWELPILPAAERPSS